MSTTPVISKLPLSQRINARMILFGVVVLLLIGTPIYLVVRATTTHGIVDRGDYKDVNLKQLGFFEIDPISGGIDSVPAHYRALDGKRIRLVGQWYPTDESGPRFTRFQLVWSIQNCCFNGPPKPQERVFAFMPPGKSAALPLDGQLISVVGTLRVKVDRNAAGNIVSVYKLDVDSWQPAS